MLTQPIGAGQPVFRAASAAFNNKPIVEFTDNEWMGADHGNIGAILTSEVTAFAVVRQRSGGGRILCVCKNGPDVGWNFNHGVPAAGLHALVGAGGGGSFSYKPGNAQTDRTNVKIVAEYVHTAANANRVYVNGTQQGVDGAVQEMNYVKAPPLGGLCFGGFYWVSHANGAPTDGLTNMADIDFAEVLFYNTHISDADRSAVRAFLGAKYGITVV